MSLIASSRTLAIVAMVALAVFLSACATTPQTSETADKPRDPFGEKPQQRLGEFLDANARPAAAPPVPPAEVADSLLPSLSLGLPDAEPRDLEPRFDLDVKGAAARSFFMSLVEGTPYNMVVHPDVDGNINLTLKNVTIPEVMELVRQVYGYEYQRSQSSFVVLPARLQSKIFYVNYLNLKRLGKSKTKVTTGELTVSQDNSSSTNDTTTVNDPNSRETEFFGTQLETTSETDYWAELRHALDTIVGSGDGRSVVVSPQSSMVVVRAMPSELRDVENFLRDAQRTTQRQVILETKILEVTLDDGFQSGINWALLINSGSSQALASQTGGGTIFGDSRVSDIAGNQGNINPDGPNPINNTAASAFGGVFSVLFNISNNFAGFIELLETQGEVQVLSSPRVSAVNNQKAVIKVGQDEFFVTDFSSTTTTGTATTTTPSVTLTPFFSGIALDVTPQISADDSVLLHIHPSVSRVQDQDKQITFGEESLTLPLALSTVRESDTIIRAKSGQIVVIGGLMEDILRDEDAATPFISDIPLVGELFKHKRQRKAKTELVILVKPLVVNHDSVWDEVVSSEAQRMQGIYRP